MERKRDRKHVTAFGWFDTAICGPGNNTVLSPFVNLSLHSLLFIELMIFFARMSIYLLYLLYMFCEKDNWQTTAQPTSPPVESTLPVEILKQ